MKLTVLLLFLGNYLAIFAQDTLFIRYDADKWDDTTSYSIDTLINESPFDGTLLIGTTMLPWTLNQQIARGYGFDFIYVKAEPCNDKERLDMKNDQIVSLIQTDSTWAVNTSIIGNCCHQFLCDIQVVNDSILNLITIGYGGGYCACVCCFGIEFGFKVQYCEKLENIKHIMINDDLKTLYHINQKGSKRHQ